MKSKNLFVLAALLLVGLSLGSYSTDTFANDSSTSEAKDTTAKVVFTPNTAPTHPLNPNDPNQPLASLYLTDPANSGTGNPGPLSLDYVPALTFGPPHANGAETTVASTNKDPYLQVSDTRIHAEGWQLTVAMTKPFTARNKVTLKGISMNWQDGMLKTAVGNTNVAPNATDITLDEDSASAVILTAPSSTGQGTWLDVFIGGSAKGKTSNNKIILTVPGGQVISKAYHSELTWTLAGAPG
ncbi:hypothetical protein BAU15_01610 [Enterococcus sp. JM4C]|uniref:WxL domain-containing protein n=1 Tax=Candidatus Enterococcus huntleyi TaxID=1857217 RepID=UPI00137A5356|nr:WxL domain-containing protein [Enterococcus sp. JM4C]KAF1299369.1 hypothetical protein BAU15_01610 [Enterococcus sp. JM4C]